MSAVLASRIAVAGTLLGSLSRYLFQRRTVLHAETVDVTALHEALAESDRLGAAAESAQFRVLLVTDDANVRELAEAAFAEVGRIGDAANRSELTEREGEFEAAVLAFVTAAGQRRR